MTAGHKHRHVSLRESSLLCRALRYPLLVLSDEHAAYVDRSRLVFGVRVSRADHHDEFPLSLLGILHGLTGLTIKVKEERRDDDRGPFPPAA